MSTTEYLKFKKASPEVQELALWVEWLKKDGRGERADLRRCGTLKEILFSPAYHRLRLAFRRLGFIDDNCLAMVTGLAARIKDDDSNGSFAEQMASGKGDGSARVSGLRFRRLLKIKEQEDLFSALIRIIALLGGCANLQSLARSVYLWNDRYIDIRKEWAFDYYSKAPNEQ